MSKKDNPKNEKDSKSSYAFAAEELITDEAAQKPALGHKSYDELLQQLEETDEKANENWEKFMRLQAEMENLRKRNERDLSQAHKYALERFAGELLPVYDNLERALEQKSEDQNLRTGVELTLKVFQSVFEKFSIKAINPLGETFDPSTSEAMSMEVSDQPAGTVVKVLQKGYQLNDRLLRPALVIVAKAG